jgi:hypothetical protein
MKQTDQVLDYLHEHGSIDPLRAFNDLGILRLGARIWDLKAAGVPIVGETKTNPNTGKRWKEYRIG